jgi:hypothetical protein
LHLWTRLRHEHASIVGTTLGDDDSGEDGVDETHPQIYGVFSHTFNLLPGLGPVGSAESGQGGTDDNEADQHGDGLRGRYLLALLNGDHATAASLETEVQQVRGSDGLLAWGQRYMAVNGDWAQSSTADRALLHQMAMDHAPSGGALAWATLYQLDELDSLPTPELPLMFKSLPRWQNTEEELSGTPIIAVLPNPATDRIAFTYGEGLEEGPLEVFDAQGRSVLTIALSGQKGLKESSVLGWSPGLYVVRLMLDGHNLGSTKFNVVR